MNELSPTMYFDSTNAKDKTGAQQKRNTTAKARTQNKLPI